ncbi:AprI/Inh family metalloprotease inhibitor [Pseudomonas sp. TTU2014-080ASC]|uniref:AprI/Inh family metalloprotease inhibitor n=1 Tax=Pseudomonas sp. TTU2014-080ASC TaxID=1729724 RepID=UPI000718799E|nr:AprI/Inh family metalloprotease inhibitor [Pseudomonas sp. TTU2014-080ASC]KRW62859.1 hypothetical protein AO726_05445 [Pseudomonas sp. TTU2014-080ASC]
MYHALRTLTVSTLLATYALNSSAGGPESRFALNAKSKDQEAQLAPAPQYAERLKGAYDLWQDGEGGPLCKVRLGDTPTIGGLSLQADEDCASKLNLAGDPYAWFINPNGQLIIIDATRQALLRMKVLEDGSYKDPRDGDYVNAVLLSRPQ